MRPGKFLADNSSERSLATRLRRRRFRILAAMIEGTPRPIRILDVGGSQAYWHMMGFADMPGVQIVLLNLRQGEPSSPPFTFVQGDGRDLSRFGDGSFDIVFSNSALEHVGGFEDQRQMAHEVRRVGRKYCVQTPNRCFPIEPHFLFPFFQFLPLTLRVWLLRHFSLGWVKRVEDEKTARDVVMGIHLLSRDEVRELFQDGDLYEERILGLVKSFVAHTPIVDGTASDWRPAVSQGMR